MSRRWSQSFACSALEELTRQLMFAPPTKRAEQCRRAETLHDEVVDDATYPLDYLAYRITGYRREARGEAGAELLVGQAVAADLRLMIDELSRSADVPLLEHESAETTEALASRLNISGKTISRWRRNGLRWRWVRPEHGGRRQIVFLDSAVRRYIASHQSQIEKATAFSQIPPDERIRLLERARRIALSRDVSLNQTAAHLARRSGRALETIRLLLEKHDRDHPEDAIFIDRSGPLTPQQRRVIARAYRMGVGVGKIARRFRRTRSTIYRAIHDRRAAAARRLPLTFVASPIFERDDADEVILRAGLSPFPDDRPATMSQAPVDDLPTPLQSLYRQRVIDDDRQRSLLVRYNYLKFKAAKTREQFDRYEPKVNELNGFEKLLEQARAVRDTLILANLPQVLSIARRHLVGKPDRSLDRLVELLADGNVAVADAVEAFNPWRGQSFSSYLTNRLLKQFVTEPDADGARRRARRRLTEQEALDRVIERARRAGVVLLDEAG